MEKSGGKKLVDYSTNLYICICMNRTPTIMHFVSRALSVYRIKLNAALQKKHIDLSSEMCSLLIALWNEDGINQQQLAASLKKDKGGITKTINHLLQRKLIKKNTDKADGRNNLICLTAKGKAAEQKIMSIIADINKVSAKNVSVQQLNDSIAVLQQMIMNLE
jgi:DNA-binding MarR family transcriptional regulator